MAALICGGSLIEGSVVAEPADQPGPLKFNLEAVILDRNGSELFHHWRDWGRADRPWQRGGRITGQATGPGALCQRRKVGDRHGNFEVVVPEGAGLVHYWLDNSVIGQGSWSPPIVAIPGATGSGAILERRGDDDLEAVGLVGAEVVHHRFDRAHGWRRVAVVTDRASGPPTMIQSSFDDHLEVVVEEGADLVLHWYDGSTWRPGGLITTGVGGPVGFVQGRYGVDPNRNFEVVVPRGDVLAGFWRDNSRSSKPWLPAGVATWGAQPVVAAAMTASSGGDSWLQVLSQEGTSIYHLYRHRLGPDGFRWMRSACIRLDDASPNDISENVRSTKVAQITGEPDKQNGGPTLSQSRTTSGIKGTDLGVRVDHDGRAFLLFGDTHWDDVNRTTLDSIAEVHEPGAERPSVVLHGSPLEIVGGDGVTDREYDVPLDAFSARGQLFTFSTSNHFQDGKVMGRSILTRALDPRLPISGDRRDHPLRFRFLSTFSSHWFINVSVQLRPAASVPGFEGPLGDVLLVWGSGGYRADDLRLAVIDLREPAFWSHLLDDHPFPIGAIGVRYFTGLCGDHPLWSWHEDDARPVLFPCALGELSVSWVEPIERYVLMTMSGVDDPIGACVWLRTAARPWGPWSNRRQVFDWIRDGFRRFIHDPNQPDDGVGEFIFSPQGNGGGAAYAPYLFDATVTDGKLLLRYALSTWNPYQSMLMRHEAPADLP